LKHEIFVAITFVIAPDAIVLASDDIFPLLILPRTKGAIIANIRILRPCSVWCVAKPTCCGHINIGWVAIDEP
jgi:hypothetical protein